MAFHPHLEAELLGGGYRPTNMILVMGVVGSNRAHATKVVALIAVNQGFRLISWLRGLAITETDIRY